MGSKGPSYMGGGEIVVRASSTRVYGSRHGVVDAVGNDDQLVLIECVLKR